MALVLPEIREHVRPAAEDSCHPHCPLIWEWEGRPTVQIQCASCLRSMPLPPDGVRVCQHCWTE